MYPWRGLMVLRAPILPSSISFTVPLILLLPEVEGGHLRNPPTPHTIRKKSTPANDCCGF
jgi:hypothetical protein